MYCGLEPVGWGLSLCSELWMGSLPSLVRFGFIQIGILGSIKILVAAISWPSLYGPCFLSILSSLRFSLRKDEGMARNLKSQNLGGKALLVIGNNKIWYTLQIPFYTLVHIWGFQNLNSKLFICPPTQPIHLLLVIHLSAYLSIYLSIII